MGEDESVCKRVYSASVNVFNQIQKLRFFQGGVLLVVNQSKCEMVG
jgi:hypothetical protein